MVTSAEPTTSSRRGEAAAGWEQRHLVDGMEVVVGKKGGRGMADVRVEKLWFERWPVGFSLNWNVSL